MRLPVPGLRRQSDAWINSMLGMLPAQVGMQHL